MLMFDNDALIKFGAWDLIEKSIQALDVSWETCRRLESIRYMLPSLRAEFVSSISDERFDYITDVVARIPVLSEEIDVDLANELLEISDIDPGEAALFSGMLSVNTAELLTGDKRALSAFAIAADSSYIERIKGRCHCVESQLLALIEVFDFETVVACLRNAIDVDTVIRVCLGTTRTVSKASFCQGLKSYTNSFDGRSLLKYVCDGSEAAIKVTDN